MLYMCLFLIRKRMKARKGILRTGFIYKDDVAISISNPS